MKKLFLFLLLIVQSSCSTIPSFHDTVSSDYKKVGKTDITLSKAFAECEVLGETARGKMVTNKLIKEAELKQSKLLFFSPKVFSFNLKPYPIS